MLNLDFFKYILLYSIIFELQLKLKSKYAYCKSIKEKFCMNASGVLPVVQNPLKSTLNFSINVLFIVASAAGNYKLKNKKMCFTDRPVEW